MDDPHAPVSYTEFTDAGTGASRLLPDWRVTRRWRYRTSWHGCSTLYEVAGAAYWLLWLTAEEGMVGEELTPAEAVSWLARTGNDIPPSLRAVARRMEVRPPAPKVPPPVPPWWRARAGGGRLFARRLEEIHRQRLAAAGAGGTPAPPLPPPAAITDATPGAPAPPRQPTPTDLAILEVVERHPGLSGPEIANKAGYAYGSVKIRLAHLKRRGRVVRHPGRPGYFLPGQPGREKVSAHG